MPRAFLGSVSTKEDITDMYASFCKNRESYNKFRDALSRHLQAIVGYVVLIERMRQYEEKAVDMVKNELGKREFIKVTFHEFYKLHEQKKHVYKKDPASCFIWLQEHCLETFLSTVKSYKRKNLDEFKECLKEHWSTEFSFIINTENDYPKISQEDTMFVDVINNTDNFTKLERLLQLGSMHTGNSLNFPESLTKVLWEEERDKLITIANNVEDERKNVKMYEHYDRIYEMGEALANIGSDEWEEFSKFILKIAKPAKILTRIEMDTSLSLDQKAKRYKIVIDQLDFSSLHIEDDNNVIDVVSSMLQKTLSDAKTWEIARQSLAEKIEDGKKTSNSFLKRILLTEKRNEWLLVIEPHEIATRLKQEVWQPIIINMLASWPDVEETVIRKRYCKWVDQLNDAWIKQIDLQLLLRYKKYKGKKWLSVVEERAEQQARSIFDDNTINADEKAKRLQNLGYQLIGDTADVDAAVRKKPAYFELQNDVSSIESFKLKYTLVTYGLARTGSEYACIRAVVRADLDDVDEAYRLLDELSRI